VPGRLGGAEEIAEIGGPHPTAGVLEDHVRMLLGEIERELLAPEAGREDQLGALLDHPFHDPFSLGFPRPDWGRSLRFFCSASRSPSSLSSE